MKLSSYSERQEVELFRMSLWNTGDIYFGEGFLKSCVRQQPFIMKDGVIEENITGLNAQMWLKEIQRDKPSKQAAWIQQRLVALPDFSYSLDEANLAIYIDDYKAHCRKDLFVHTRISDRALFSFGVVPMRFASEEVLTRSDICVKDSLSMLEKIMERRESYVELPTREICLNLVPRDSAQPPAVISIK